MKNPRKKEFMKDLKIKIFPTVQERYIQKLEDSMNRFMVGLNVVEVTMHTIAGDDNNQNEFSAIVVYRE